MDDPLFDRYLDDALAGRLHSPEGYLRRHGRDDPQLLRQLSDVYAQLAGARDGTLQARAGYGEKVGPFRLLRPIDRGGYGEVFEAEDDSGRRCALKLMRFEWRTSEERRERMVREARAVQQLVHPHIVRLLEAGEHDGCLYLAMELVEGRTLRSIVRADPPAPERVLRWGIAIARALEAIHREGFIHRDVKPANIMIRTDDSPVLLDFGLVLDTVADLATLTCGFVGTAAYASPEQAAGQRGFISPLSDLYSLAATLFYALSGRPPFKRTPRNRRQAPLLSGLVPALPPALDAVMQTALAWDPRARQASLEEFAVALEAALPELSRSADHHADLSAWEPVLERAEVEADTLLRTFGGAQEPRALARLDDAVPFVLEEPIGHGGHGVVYRGAQLRLDRTVAIKVVRDDARGFLAEALLASQLEHPNILPVYDLLRSTDGDAVQLAMKLVEGESWAARLRGREPDRDAELEVLIALCNAVAFAHSRGVLHNDLKPANVLLGAYGEVLLADWGVAVELAADDQARIRSRTAIDGPWGTPAYMSPELAAGDPAALTVRSDVYQLGAVLYELLCGRPPNDRKRFLALVLGMAPDPLLFPADQPAELVALCRDALALDAARRPPSAEVFQQRLRDYFQHRESRALCDAAAVRLERCEARIDATDVPRAGLYQELAAIVASFTEARRLHASEAAARGLREARLTYARAALRRGDFGLADTQLAALADPEFEAGRILRLAVDAGKQQRDRDQRSRRLLRRGAVLAAGLFLCGAIAFAIVRERDAARIERSYQAANSYARAAIQALFTVSDNFGGEMLEQLGSTRGGPALDELRRNSLRGWQRLLEAGHGADLGQRVVMHMRIASLHGRIDPGDPAFRYHRSQALALAGQLEDSERERRMLAVLAAEHASWLSIDQAWPEAVAVAQDGLRRLETLDAAKPDFDPSATRFQLLFVLAKAYRGLRQPERATRAMRDALALLKAHPLDLRGLYFPHATYLVDLLTEQGRMDEAYAASRRTLTEIEAWLAARPTSVLRCETLVAALVRHAELEVWQQAPARALESLIAADEQLEQLRVRFPLLERQRTQHGLVLHRLERLARSHGQVERADSCLRRLAALLESADEQPLSPEAVLLCEGTVVRRQIINAASPAALATARGKGAALFDRVLERLHGNPSANFDLQYPLINLCVRLAPWVAEEALPLEKMHALSELPILNERGMDWPRRLLFSDVLQCRAELALERGLAEQALADSRRGRAVLQAGDRTPSTLATAQCMLIEGRALDVQRELVAAREVTEAALEMLAPRGDFPAVLLRCDAALLLSRLIFTPGAYDAEPLSTPEVVARRRTLVEETLALLETLPDGLPDKAVFHTEASEELAWIELLGGDPSHALELAESSLSARLERRARGVEGLEGMRRRGRSYILLYECLRTLDRDADAVEVGLALSDDYRALVSAPEPRHSDRFDALAWLATFAVHRSLRGDHSLAAELAADGLRYAEPLLNSDAAIRIDFVRAAQLALVLAGSTRRLEPRSAAERRAIALLRTAFERFDGDAELELQLAVALQANARTSRLIGLTEDARSAARQAAEIAERHSATELAAACHELLEQLEDER